MRPSAARARRVLVTMGDAAGIGPECIVKAWQAGALERVVVLGDVRVMRRAARQVGGVEAVVARSEDPSDAVA